MAGMKRVTWVFGGSLLLSLLWLDVTQNVAIGGEKGEQDIVREALRRGEVLPLAKVLAIAAAQVPGDVIEVELESKHGVLVYEIKVLTDTGRVREIKINAGTGAVLKIEDD
ncbi:MAG: hypothetical protein CMLOHMNK_01361 [Steroidobacteraceae bacterium]|nr:hypothetical protein [Steroidobacteraceae bacterium]